MLEMFGGVNHISLQDKYCIYNYFVRQHIDCRFCLAKEYLSLVYNNDVIKMTTKSQDTFVNHWIFGLTV